MIYEPQSKIFLEMPKSTLYTDFVFLTSKEREAFNNYKPSDVEPRIYRDYLYVEISFNKEKIGCMSK